MKRGIAGVVLGLLLAAPAAHAVDTKPAAGTIIMRIRIPAIGVNMPVVEGDPPANEDGFYPVHYRSTNWPVWGETVAISAHHYTHALPGADGGPFRHADQLKRPDLINLTMVAPFGTATTAYVVSGHKVVNCGWDKINCPAIRRYFVKMWQNKLILTTCIGDGSRRLMIFAYEAKGKALPKRR